MGYLGVFLKGFQLGKEAAEDVKVINLHTMAGKEKFMDKAYRNVEAYQQQGCYSYIGGELMRMRNPDAAVSKYDDAVHAGIKSVLAKRLKIKRRPVVRRK